MDFLLHTKIEGGKRFLDDRQRAVPWWRGFDRRAYAHLNRESFSVEMRGKKPPVVRRWDPIAKHFSVHHGLTAAEEDRVVALVRGVFG